VPLHGVEVGVWCVHSAWRIIWPVFLHETVNYGCYVRLILSDQLTGKEKSCGPFLQDNAMAYTVNNSVDALDKVFI
jgi:hypothetical protein